MSHTSNQRYVQISRADGEMAMYLPHRRLGAVVERDKKTRNADGQTDDDQADR